MDCETWTKFVGCCYENWAATYGAHISEDIDLTPPSKWFTIYVIPPEFNNFRDYVIAHLNKNMSNNVVRVVRAFRKIIRNRAWTVKELNYLYIIQKRDWVYKLSNYHVMSG